MSETRHGNGQQASLETFKTKAAPRVTKRHRTPAKGEWVKFPRRWMEALAIARCSGSAYRLALTILNEAYKRRYADGWIVLSSVVTQMSRTTKRDAAAQLETLGLIVTRQEGCRALEVRPLL
jgi:hypothetical protein